MSGEMSPAGPSGVNIFILGKQLVKVEIIIQAKNKTKSFFIPLSFFSVMDKNMKASYHKLQNVTITLAKEGSYLTMVGGRLFGPPFTFFNDQLLFKKCKCEFRDAGYDRQC
jgi:hypothetical protein